MTVPANYGTEYRLIMANAVARIRRSLLRMSVGDKRTTTDYIYHTEQKGKINHQEGSTNRSMAHMNKFT